MLCGIDEAGRGCICGSMFMCGVLGKEENLKHLNIKDSKMLSESSRQDLAYKLVGLKSALKEITEHFSTNTCEFIFDGNTTFGLTLQHPKVLRTLVKGDSKSLLIGAASILAKVAKDTQMHELDKIYPHYGFKTNKGYGTKAHIQAIMKYGYTPFHRRSFAITPSFAL